MKVGFIGLGSMGMPMARKIARSGFPLVACDNSAKTLDAFDEPGASREKDPIAVAKQVDVLAVCVRTDEQLNALAGDGSLFAALGDGKTFIVHSTVAPEFVRELAREAGRYGVAVIDACVSGGGPAALKGELLLLVGGEEATFEKIKPLLETYGKTIVHLGPVGRGMEAKLLNNLVSIAYYGMAASVLDLGERLNFDREQLRQALLAGSAEGFALKAVPGLLKPKGPGATGDVQSLKDLLEKDLILGRKLAPADDIALSALLTAGQTMIDRLARVPQDGG